MVNQLAEVSTIFLFSSHSKQEGKRQCEMEWASLNNNRNYILTFPIMDEGFPGPHDPEACVEITFSLVSHSKELKGLAHTRG